ncbi:unnamed protein product [Phaeothamnion confervicola]
MSEKAGVDTEASNSESGRVSLVAGAATATAAIEVLAALSERPDVCDRILGSGSDLSCICDLICRAAEPSSRGSALWPAARQALRCMRLLTAMPLPPSDGASASGVDDAGTAVAAPARLLLRLGLDARQRLDAVIRLADEDTAPDDLVRSVFNLVVATPSASRSTETALLAVAAASPVLDSIIRQRSFVLLAGLLRLSGLGNADGGGRGGDGAQGSKDLERVVNALATALLAACRLGADGGGSGKDESDLADAVNPAAAAAAVAAGAVAALLQAWRTDAAFARALRVLVAASGGRSAAIALLTAGIVSGIGASAGLAEPPAERGVAVASRILPTALASLLASAHADLRADGTALFICITDGGADLTALLMRSLHGAGVREAALTSLRTAAFDSGPAASDALRAAMRAAMAIAATPATHDLATGAEKTGAPAPAATAAEVALVADICASAAPLAFEAGRGAPPWLLPSLAALAVAVPRCAAALLRQDAVASALAVASAWAALCDYDRSGGGTNRTGGIPAASSGGAVVSDDECVGVLRLVTALASSLPEAASAAVSTPGGGIDKLAEVLIAATANAHSPAPRPVAVAEAVLAVLRGLSAAPVAGRSNLTAMGMSEQLRRGLAACVGGCCGPSSAAASLRVLVSIGEIGELGCMVAATPGLVSGAAAAVASYAAAAMAGRAAAATAAATSAAPSTPGEDAGTTAAEVGAVSTAATETPPHVQLGGKEMTDLDVALAAAGLLRCVASSLSVLAGDDSHGGGGDGGGGTAVAVGAATAMVAILEAGALPSALLHEATLFLLVLSWADVALLESAAELDEVFAGGRLAKAVVAQLPTSRCSGFADGGGGSDRGGGDGNGGSGDSGGGCSEAALDEAVRLATAWSGLLVSIAGRLGGRKALFEAGAVRMILGTLLEPPGGIEKSTGPSADADVGRTAAAAATADPVAADLLHVLCVLSATAEYRAEAKTTLAALTRDCKDGPLVTLARTARRCGAGRWLSLFCSLLGTPAPVLPAEGRARSAPAPLPPAAGGGASDGCRRREPSLSMATSLAQCGSPLLPPPSPAQPSSSLPPLSSPPRRPLPTPPPRPSPPPPQVGSATPPRPLGGGDVDVTGDMGSSYDRADSYRAERERKREPEREREVRCSNGGCRTQLFLPEGLDPSSIACPNCGTPVAPP